jgi:threonine dehydrogenase-like Zn-dependent dehydrogenase
VTGEVPKPRLVEERDVLVKVTGSTVCGSDLHLLHGSIVQLEKGDILGHEFCGVIESLGPSVTGLKIGDRVVASFQIACGDVFVFLGAIGVFSADILSATIVIRDCLLSARRQIQTLCHTICMAGEPQAYSGTAISPADSLVDRQSTSEFPMETLIS